ncbi:hypothetical protein ATY30_26650 [Sinorhizobium americanum]|nr:hypothetical protein CO664_22270 [Sinorhizobium sp. NG07B]POH25767.1 hypothetical protein ATY30_26650 [Sinorhizobium americanum]
MIAREDAPHTQVIRSPILRRQEVRETFGSDISALNKVIFDSVNAENEINAPDLNQRLQGRWPTRFHAFA